MKIFITVLLVAIALHIQAKKDDDARQWALLVAGSNGYYNYRHQADIARAYKIIIGRGIPASRVIVMMYDDVVNDSSNPTPGVLINEPGGPNVYEGIKIDYKGEDVNPQVFLDVLSGNKSAVSGKGTGRVIESGPKDHVFVNFADHGGTGVLCFPEDDLNAADLISTLDQLTKNKKYKELVMFIEACEAGSNFDQLLPENTRILASTASASDESSYAAFCDYKDYPCLGDLYSVSWMDLVEKKHLATENIFNEYQAVRSLTTKSHVQLYGDYSVGSHFGQEFVGPHNTSSHVKGSRKAFKNSLVSSRDVAMHYFKRMANKAKNKVDKLKYSQLASELEKKRLLIDQTVEEVIIRVSNSNDDDHHEISKKRQPLAKTMLSCYSRLYRHFSKRCFNLSKNQYILKHFYKFANICHKGTSFEERTIQVIETVCHDNFPVITDTF